MRYVGRNRKGQLHRAAPKAQRQRADCQGERQLEGTTACVEWTPCPVWHVADGTTVCPWYVACDMRWHHVNRNGRGRVPEGTTGCNQGVAQGSARALLMPQPRAGRGGRPESARRVARSTLRERGAQSTSGAWAGSKRSSSQEVGWLGRPYGVLPSQCDSATRSETGDLCTRWWTHTCVETTEAVRVVPTCPHRSVQSHGEVDRGVRGSRVSPAAAPPQARDTFKGRLVPNVAFWNQKKISRKAPGRWPK